MNSLVKRLTEKLNKNVFKEKIVQAEQSITPQKVSNFMKKYMPNFYETKCFKRKSKNNLTN